jgi:hypothetical protein
METGMFGGLIRSASILTLCAAAGIAMGGVSPAKAADLGGDCCADLEERVANLEATTVRKGNKLVSLTLSGHVNRAMMWYDDGSMTGVRSVDNIMSHSRFRLLGSAKVAPGWSIGYYQEFEFSTASSAGVSQLDDRGFNTAGGNLQTSSPFNFAIRQSHWYMKNDSLGTLSVGRLNTATKDMPGIELGNIAIIAASDTLQMNNFILRSKGKAGREGLSAGGAAGPVRLSAYRQYSSDDRLRTDGVRYDSPTLMGFTLSAAAGDDYLWDVALRYAGEWNGIRVSSGIGYYSDMDEGGCDTTNATTQLAASCFTGLTVKTGRREREVFKYNSSVLHVSSGLFLSGAYWRNSYNGSGAVDNQVAGFTNGVLTQRPDAKMSWIAAGLRRNWFGIGDTSIYGEYQRMDGQIDGTTQNFSPSLVAGTPGNFGVVTDSGMTKWGFGMIQNIDKAATTLYISYHDYSPEAKGCAVAAAAVTPTCVVTNQALEHIRSVQAGAIVRF